MNASMPRWSSCDVALVDTRIESFRKAPSFPTWNALYETLRGGNLIHNSTHDRGFPRGLIVHARSRDWSVAQARARASPRVVISTRAFTCPDYDTPRALLSPSRCRNVIDRRGTTPWWVISTSRICSASQSISITRRAVKFNVREIVANSRCDIFTGDFSVRISGKILECATWDRTSKFGRRARRSRVK